MTPDAPSGPAPVVVVEDDDAAAVRIVRFNRPEARNAFDAALYEGVTQAITDAALSSEVHVVVLTGAGSAFSAGQDLKEMARIVTGQATPEAAKGFRGLLDAVGSFQKPLLAAVNGVGVGLGFTLLAQCDLVLMADDARLRVPFAELGVPPEAASSYLFPRTMGWQRAAHLLFTGTWMGAREAVDAGIALAHHPAGVVAGRDPGHRPRHRGGTTRGRHDGQAAAAGDPVRRGGRGPPARGRSLRRAAGLGRQPGRTRAVRLRLRDVRPGQVLAGSG